MHGYEIHVGRSDGPDRARPIFTIEGKQEGATSPDGRVMGSYIHGLFNDDQFRAAFLKSLGHAASGKSYQHGVETTLDALADHFAQHMDVDGLIKVAERGL